MAAVVSGAVAVALDRAAARRTIGRLAHVVPGSLAALSLAQERLAEASLPVVGPESHGNGRTAKSAKDRESGMTADGKSAKNRKREAVT